MINTILVFCFIMLEAFYPGQPGGFVSPERHAALDYPPGQAGTTPAAPPSVCVAAETMHVRFVRDRQAPIAGWFPQGQTLDVLDRDTSMWKVHGHGFEFSGRPARMTGFVDPDFIECKPGGFGPPECSDAGMEPAVQP